MKFLNYIRGNRKGENAHIIESQSLSDPFLREAIDGYDRRPAAGSEYIRTIAALEKELGTAVTSSLSWKPVYWLPLVGLLVVVGVVVWFFAFRPTTDDSVINPASTTETVIIMDPQPEAPTTLPADTVTDSVPVREYNEALDGVEEPEYLGSVQEPVTDPVSETTLPSEPSQPSNQQATALPEEGVQREEMIFTISPPEDTEALQMGVKYYSQPRVGRRQFNEYLHRAMVRPESEQHGEVIVSFRVNQYGRPSQIRAEQGFSREANREAIRLLESGPEWTPTENRVMVTIQF